MCVCVCCLFKGSMAKRLPGAWPSVNVEAEWFGGHVRWGMNMTTMITSFPRQAHGHAAVPQTDKEGASLPLGMWLAAQVGPLERGNTNSSLQAHLTWSRLGRTGCRYGSCVERGLDAGYYTP